jgi:hypothetical protein
MFIKTKYSRKTKTPHPKITLHRIKYLKINGRRHGLIMKNKTAVKA